jgi:hypothetical protein
MATHHAIYSQEECARRGTEIYEREIRPLVESSSRGRIVAIDIETGSYSVADDNLSAADNLFQKLPNAQIWFVRVGYPAVHRIGPRMQVKAND